MPSTTPTSSCNWVMFVPLAIVAALRLLAAPGWRRGLVFGADGGRTVARLDVHRRDADVVSRAVPDRGRGRVARPANAGSCSRARSRRDWCSRRPWPFSGIPYMLSRSAHGERGLQEVTGWQRAADRLRRDPLPAGQLYLALAPGRSRRARDLSRDLDAGTGGDRHDPAAHGRLDCGDRGRSRHLRLVARAERTHLRASSTPRSMVYRGMRVPARFSVVLGSALALLGAIARCAA